MQPISIGQVIDGAPADWAVNLTSSEPGTVFGSAEIIGYI